MRRGRILLFMWQIRFYFQGRIPEDLQKAVHDAAVASLMRQLGAWQLMKEAPNHRNHVRGLLSEAVVGRTATLNTRDSFCQDSATAAAATSQLKGGVEKLRIHLYNILKNSFYFDLLSQHQTKNAAAVWNSGFYSLSPLLGDSTEEVVVYLNCFT